MHWNWIPTSSQLRSSPLIRELCDHALANGSQLRYHKWLVKFRKLFWSLPYDKSNFLLLYLWHCIYWVKHTILYLVGHYYPTLKQIRNILKPDISGLAARWLDLGRELLTDDTVGVSDVIKADHPNDASACCNKIFVKWLELQPDASWSQLITALRNIGMKSAAENIIKHFIKGLCSNHFINIYVLLKFNIDFRTMNSKLWHVSNFIYTCLCFTCMYVHTYYYCIK